jgi:hypothetical protein
VSKALRGTEQIISDYSLTPEHHCHPIYFDLSKGCHSERVWKGLVRPIDMTFQLLRRKEQLPCPWRSEKSLQHSSSFNPVPLSERKPSSSSTCLSALMATAVRTNGSRHTLPQKGAAGPSHHSAIRHRHPCGQQASTHVGCAGDRRRGPSA